MCFRFLNHHLLTRKVCDNIVKVFRYRMQRSILVQNYVYIINNQFNDKTNTLVTGFGMYRQIFIYIPIDVLAKYYSTFTDCHYIYIWGGGERTQLPPPCINVYMHTTDSRNYITSVLQVMSKWFTENILIYSQHHLSLKLGNNLVNI